MSLHALDQCPFYGLFFFLYNKVPTINPVKWRNCQSLAKKWQILAMVHGNIVNCCCRVGWRKCNTLCWVWLSQCSDYKKHTCMYNKESDVRYAMSNSVYIKLRNSKEMLSDGNLILSSNHNSCHCLLK